MEGFEVAIATLLEKMSICEFYSGIYNGVSLPSQSTTNSSQLQGMLDSALPELYAAVIVFSVKARTYFEVKGTFWLQTPTLTYIYIQSLFKISFILNQNQGCKRLSMH